MKWKVIKYWKKQQMLTQCYFNVCVPSIMYKFTVLQDTISNSTSNILPICFNFRVPWLSTTSQKNHPVIWVCSVSRRLSPYLWQTYSFLAWEHTSTTENRYINRPNVCAQCNIYGGISWHECYLHLWLPVLLISWGSSFMDLYSFACGIFIMWIFFSLSTLYIGSNFILAWPLNRM